MAFCQQPVATGLMRLAPHGHIHPVQQFLRSTEHGLHQHTGENPHDQQNMTFENKVLLLVCWRNLNHINVV